MTNSIEYKVSHYDTVPSDINNLFMTCLTYIHTVRGTSDEVLATLGLESHVLLVRYWPYPISCTGYAMCLLILSKALISIHRYK